MRNEFVTDCLVSPSENNNSTFCLLIKFVASNNDITSTIFCRLGRGGEAHNYYSLGRINITITLYLNAIV